MTRPLRSRLAAAAATATMLALLAAGCGDEDGSDDDADDPGGSQTSETVSPSESASESSSESPEESPTDSPSEPDSSDGGEAAELPAWAPKILTNADDSVTGLDFTGTLQPTGELQVATVIEGDGPPIEVGQTITANYFGSIYQGQEPFDESYSSAPFQAPIGVGSLIQGWDQSIPGLPVGSRIIMSIPPELAYGDADQPGIPGGSTLFFVIDILDAK